MFHRSVFIVIAILLALTLSNRAGAATRIALVIGNGAYPNIGELANPSNDARLMADTLRQLDFEVIEKINVSQKPMKKAIKAFGNRLNRAGKDAVGLFYYAGHGAPETDATSPDGDGLEKYLIPYDADPQDLYTTGLPMREVETIFHRLNAERVIFITDSCYSGATGGRTFATAARRAVVSDNFLTRLSKGKGRVVLTASRAGEVSEERDDLGHGVFTYYLLQGLKGKADFDADGLITVDEAYSYVSTHVPSATGQNQHPLKKGEVEGQLILGRVR